MAPATGASRRAQPCRPASAVPPPFAPRPCPRPPRRVPSLCRVRAVARVTRRLCRQERVVRCRREDGTARSGISLRLEVGDLAQRRTRRCCGPGSGRAWRGLRGGRALVGLEAGAEGACSRLVTSSVGRCHAD